MIISIAAVLGYISSTFFISVWNPLNDLTNPCESPKRDNYSNKSYIKPDPGLCTSNEGGFFNFFFFNTLDNGLGLLFCLHNFVFRRSIDVQGVQMKKYFFSRSNRMPYTDQIKDIASYVRTCFWVSPSNINIMYDCD